MSPGFLACTVLVASTAALLVPQQFRSKTEIVDVYATVRDKDHAIKTGLVKEDFELFEDGKPVEIAVFSQGIQPLSAVLILDHSGSTEMQFDDVTRAAQEFVGRLLRHDRASVMSLTWDCLPFTDDSREMLSLLRMQLPEDYGSPIWSATNRALAALETETAQRVVILFSDGEDNQSLSGMSGEVEPGVLNPCRYVRAGKYQKFSDVSNRAQAASTMVYTVSVGSGTGDMVSIARDTGASFQKLGNYSELRSAFRGIADELHLQYVLGFVPTKSDGKEHKIEVKLKPAGMTVRARKAYVAGK